MLKKNVVLQEALTFLKNLVKEDTWQEKGCLPSIRQMARMADCSHYTMWKAVKICGEEGLFKVLHGKRIRLHSGPGQKEETRETAGEALASTMNKWEKVQAQLEQDIFSGIFKPGERLPSFKELQTIYQSSYITIRKALQPLVQKGILNSSLKISDASPSGNQNSSLSLVYLAWGDNWGIFKQPTPFEYSLMNLLDNECANLNIRFEKIAYTFKNNKIVFIHKGRHYKKLPSICRQAVGSVVRTACTHDIVKTVLTPLASYGKPVAVMDEKGLPSLNELRKKKPNVLVFDHTISQDAGRMMGSYLLQRGFTRAAFISPWQKTLWSQNRFKGLQGTFEASSRRCTMVPFLQELEYELPFEEQSTRAGEILRDALQGSRARWNTSLPSLSVLTRALEPGIKAAIRKEQTLDTIKPILKKALETPDIQVLVAVDDETALLILEYLKRRNIKVPERISLAGFDDTPEAAQHDLTSYNFNFQRFVHTVIMHILRSTNFRLRHLAAPRNIPGNIIERGSVKLISAETKS